MLDVCGTVEEAALLSVLARTLVDDAVERIGRGEPEGDPIPQEVLRGYLWQASRDGFEGECLDPAERAVRPVADIVGELVRRMPDEDRAFAEDVLGMLRTDGGGARRQRRVHDRREDYNESSTSSRPRPHPEPRPQLELSVTYGHHSME